MLTPNSGNAVMNGQSILTDMPSIRADLGCCPQFDILWPEITVLEHLSIYAAIKGFRGADARDAAAAAAAEVGGLQSSAHLLEQEHSMAQLSRLWMLPAEGHPHCQANPLLNGANMCCRQGLAAQTWVMLQPCCTTSM